MQEIAVRSGKVEIELFTIYILSVAACCSVYSPLDFLLEGQNRITLGDLNTHQDSWFSELGCDRRGNLLAEQIDVARQMSL